jgi:hypothetical protein
MKFNITKKKLKILDFDIESRPLSWITNDYVTKEVTAIAAKFIDEKRVHCWLLGKDDMNIAFKEFRELYDEADIVTGHYIRGYDLPTLNGALTEYGYRPLSSKLAHDTKLDLITRQGMSGSQENLAAMLGLKRPKIHMTQQDWREANRLKPMGILKTKKRVISDVEQHIELRQKLLELNMLGPPKMWKSSHSAKTKYYP